MNTLIAFLFIFLTNPGAMEMLRENPDRVGITTHIYEFGPETVTPAPRGYKPFYLSHYGRHGARTEVKGSENRYLELERTLQSAADKGILKVEGYELLDETRQVIAALDDMPGRLTRIGEAEHRELAKRIYNHYRPVFRDGNRKVRVESSTVPRCLVSMAAFTNSLTSIQSDLQYTMDTGEKFFAIINNSSPKELRQMVNARLDSLEAATYRTVDTVTVMERLFTDPEAARKLMSSVYNFQYNIFKVAVIAVSSGVKTDVTRHLPMDVLYYFWADRLRYIYMNQCNSVEYGHIRMPYAEPLVRDIMLKADEAVREGTVCADLKFGHDYPLLALTSYLQLSGVGDRMTFDEVPDKWCNPRNIPFASNLQIVFYRNRKGDVLCKFVYNGEERTVRDLTPVETVFYRWSDVKDKFLSSK